VPKHATVVEPTFATQSEHRFSCRSIPHWQCPECRPADVQWNSSIIRETPDCRISGHFNDRQSPAPLPLELWVLELRDALGPPTTVTSRPAFVNSRIQGPARVHQTSVEGQWSFDAKLSGRIGTCPHRLLLHIQPSTCSDSIRNWYCCTLTLLPSDEPILALGHFVLYGDSHMTHCDCASIRRLGAVVLRGSP
jgi:hypothetical protein